MGMASHPWLLAVVLAGTMGLQAYAITFDLNQDWLAGIVAQGVNGCVLAPQAQNRSLPVLATPLPGSISVNEIITQKAWLLSPLVFMHPLEWSQLTDPAAWISTSPVYNPLTLKVQSYGPPPQNLSSLQTQLAYLTVLGIRTFASQVFPYGFNTSEQRISTATLKQRVKGDPIDPRTNYTTAKVWYTAMDAADSASETNYTRGQAVIIKYHYFYPFNGCSNQVFGMNLGSKYQGIEYYMCAPGIHEGDWEHISMLVSVADWNETNPSQAIKRVQYAAHSWNAQYDCYLGECVFEADDQGRKRLVAYAGLYSHAMYPTASALQLYQQVSAQTLLSVDGIYIGDRTARGGAVFQPTANNTRYLPLMANMTLEQLNGEFAWAVYPGSWGGYLFANEKGSNMTVTCFSNNFTVEGSCAAGNPATEYIQYFLNLVADVVNIGELIWYNTIKSPFYVDPITGPLMRTYTYQWETENQAPLWAEPVQGVTPACPFSGDPTITNEKGATFENPNILAFLIGTTIILLFCGLVFTVTIFFPGVRSTEPELRQMVTHIQSYMPLRTTVDDVGQGVLHAPLKLAGHDPGADDEYYGWRPLAFMLIAISAYISGIVLSVIGIQAVFQALARIYDLAIYDQLEQAFVAVLIIFGSWQLVVLLTVLFIRSERVALLGGIHVIAINCTMLLFAMGFFVSVCQILFQVACNTALEKLFTLTNADQLCLDLTSVGINTVICGAELADTCRMWSGLRIHWVAYGAVLVALSHCMFLAMSVHQSVILSQGWLLLKWLRDGRMEDSTSPGWRLWGRNKQEVEAQQATDNQRLNGAHSSDERTPSYMDVQGNGGGAAHTPPIKVEMQAGSQTYTA